MAQLTLRSSIDQDFTIVVDDRVINSSSILQNVKVHTNDNGEVPVDMTKQQLQKFVEFHNHFATADAPKDLEFSNKFFGELNEEEFKALCWKADFLDSQRFLEASGDFILHKFEDAEVSEIQRYLNIEDDYTADERRAIDEHPLEYFTGVSIQNTDEPGPGTSE